MAKKMGDEPLANHIIGLVEGYLEEGRSAPWKTLDKMVIEHGTPETIAAYHEWRDAVIASH